MERCEACGAQRDEGAAFCRKCGKPVGEAGAGAGAQQAPPQPLQGRPQPQQQQPQQPRPGPLDAPLPPQPPPYPPTGFPRSLPGFGYRQEGVPEGPPVYGGFWVRFVAFIIDMAIVAFIFSWPIRFAGTNPGLVFSFAGVLYLGAFFTYVILMTGHFGQTLGKMALRLKVVSQDMTTIDYGVAATREFSLILSALIFFIGFIMAGFDSRKRALHDRIARTCVLRY